MLINVHSFFRGLGATAASPPIRQFLNIFFFIFTQVSLCVCVLSAVLKTYLVIVFFSLLPYEI